MGNNQIQLHHIAINVTNLERSRKFYREVLQMTVGEPISLREQSAGLKYGHSIIRHGPDIVKNWVSKVRPAAYRHMYSDICHCSSAKGLINLILVQQTHPEKGYTRSVTGNTIYGFSYLLSGDVDCDDLGWDLTIADVPFQHGDCRTDGAAYSPDHDCHSVYIRDPDGRMIELTPSTSEHESEGLIIGTGHVTLYVTDMQESIRFYVQRLGLCDITPDNIPRNPFKKNITWLGVPGSNPVILLYQVMHPDGTREETGGYGLDHIALTIDIQANEVISDPPCVTNHPVGDSDIKNKYFTDPDGYVIEIIKP
jgi:catechol 2,3-dioxygenase-like lactoylglutathione lyase family enzyme